MIQQLITRITHVRPATLFAIAFACVLIAGAETAHAVTDLRDLICESGYLVSSISGLLVAVAVVVFLWGLVRFIANAGNEEERKRGRQVMVWGIVAIFIILSLGGVIAFLQRSVFETTNQGDIGGLYGDPCD